MKYFSMFSGIGGFELGIYRANVSLAKRLQQNNLDTDSNMSNSIEQRLATQPLCVGFSEVDKYAIQIYTKQFKGHKNYGDCTKIKWEDVEDFELLVGGFPCQAFSIAGKRGGFSDTRGTLFFEIDRCLKEKQPRLFLLENVKGLLSHDKGQTGITILSTLDELGYDVQWQVLNSKNFGVPQNRERVFFVGHLRGTSRPEVFPIGEINTEVNSKIKIVGYVNKEHETNAYYKTDGIIPTLRAGVGGQTHGQAIEIICPTLITELAHSTGRDFFRTMGKKIFEASNQIRRLTPIECERLQGFPDDWTEKGVDGNGSEIKISDTQRYKCLGNAVTVNAIEEIIKKL